MSAKLPDYSNAVFFQIFGLYLRPHLFDDFKRTRKLSPNWPVLDREEFDGICSTVEAMKDRHPGGVISFRDARENSGHEHLQR